MCDVDAMQAQLTAAQQELRRLVSVRGGAFAVPGEPVNDWEQLQHRMEFVNWWYVGFSLASLLAFIVCSSAVIDVAMALLSVSTNTADAAGFTKDDEGRLRDAACHGDVDAADTVARQVIEDEGLDHLNPDGERRRTLHAMLLYAIGLVIFVACFGFIAVATLATMIAIPDDAEEPLTGRWLPLGWERLPLLEQVSQFAGAGFNMAMDFLNLGEMVSNGLALLGLYLWAPLIATAADIMLTWRGPATALAEESASHARQQALAAALIAGGATSATVRDVLSDDHEQCLLAQKGHAHAPGSDGLLDQRIGRAFANRKIRVESLPSPVPLPQLEEAAGSPLAGK